MYRYNVDKYSMYLNMQGLSLVWGKGEVPAGVSVGELVDPAVAEAIKDRTSGFKQSAMAAKDFLQRFVTTTNVTVNYCTMRHKESSTWV